MAKISFVVRPSAEERAKRQRAKEVMAWREGLKARAGALAGKEKAGVTLADIYEQNRIIIELLAGPRQ